MTRQRIFLLWACLGFFLIVSTLIILLRVQFNRTHYRVGSVPIEIINQLTPKTVPIESIRPPALRPIDPVRYGNVTSVLSVIEYGDFECEACRRLAPEIKRALEPYKGRVRFVWRDFPIIDQHPDALDAAIFGRCAHLQGKFWDVYEPLMNSATLSDRIYRDIASRARLDLDELATCRRSPEVEASIRRDVEEARADGIQSAPFLFVGTTPIEGFIDADTLTETIDASLSAL